MFYKIVDNKINRINYIEEVEQHLDVNRMHILLALSIQIMWELLCLIDNVFIQRLSLSHLPLGVWGQVAPKYRTTFQNI